MTCFPSAHFYDARTSRKDSPVFEAATAVVSVARIPPKKPCKPATLPGSKTFPDVPAIQVRMSKECAHGRSPVRSPYPRICHPGARADPCSSERWASLDSRRLPVPHCTMPKRLAVDSADRACRSPALDRSARAGHANSPATAHPVSASARKPESAIRAIPTWASAFPIDRTVPAAARRSMMSANAAVTLVSQHCRPHKEEPSLSAVEGISSRRVVSQLVRSSPGIPGDETGG